MGAEKPKRLNHNIANFLAGLGALSLSSGISLIPHIDTDAKGEIVPLLLTLAFGFFGWKASDLLIKTIKDKNLSAKREAVVIWCLPIFYFVIYTAINTVFFAYQRKPPMEIQEHSVIVQEKISEANLDNEALKNIETMLVKEFKAYMNEYLTNNYMQNTEWIKDLRYSSSYSQSNGRKLAIVRLAWGNKIQGVYINGIRGNRITTVSCTAFTNKEISILDGKCGDKVMKTFNPQ